MDSQEHNLTILGQIVKHIPPKLIDSLKRKHRIQTRAFSATSHVVAMLFAQRHIANLARQVIAYDRQHGALPASLDLVSNDFKDSIDHNPFLFETKDL